MDETLKSQVRQRLREQDTEELIQIWKKHDQTEWTDEAFEIISEILLERTGTLPTPSATEAAAPIADADSAQDTYYNFEHLMNVTTWARTLAWFFMGAAGLLLLMSACVGFQLFRQLLSARDFFETGFLFLSPLLIATVALICVFFFVLLQALAEGLYLLMDIEDNTRSTVKVEA